MTANIPDSPLSIRVPELDLLRLNASLGEILKGPKDDAGKLLDLLSLTVSLINAGGVVLFSQTEQGLVPGTRLVSKQAADMIPDLEQHMLQGATQALEQGKVHLKGLDTRPETTLVAVPMPNAPRRAALCALLVFKDNAPEPFLAILQIMAAHIGLWLASSSAPSQARPDLLVLADAALSLGRGSKTRAAFALAQSLARASGADRVFLGLAKSSTRVVLAAASGATMINTRGDLPRAVENAFAECVLRGATLMHPLPETLPPDSDVSASPLLKQALSEAGAESGLCLPLFTEEQTPSGALLLCFGEGKTRGPAIALPHLREAGPALAGCLAAMVRLPKGAAQASPLTLWARRHKRKLQLGLAALAMVMLLFPLPHKVTGASTATPKVRRFVVAQFDGSLKESMVQPGDPVTRGQTLAMMDGKEIELEIASLRAELDMAEKQRTMHLASGEMALVQLAALERDKLSRRITYLQGLLEQLDIVSPLDGVLLSGDLRRSVGSPLSKGQPLFEVAPLGSMVVEISVDQGDVPYVEPGMEIRAVFDTFPGRVWEGTVETILPATELRQGRYVFVAEMTVDNPEGLLKPGMTGEADITVGRRCLAWTLLRKPVNALRTFLRL